MRELNSLRGAKNFKRLLMLTILGLALAVAVTSWAWQKSGNNFFYIGRVLIGVESPTAQHATDANAYLQVHNPDSTGGNHEVARFTARENRPESFCYITVGDAVLDRKGTQGYLGYSPGSAKWAIGTHFYPPTLTVMSMEKGGYVGIGQASPNYPLHLKNGAYVSQGGVWTNASSRDYKENIQELSPERAASALKDLRPVTFQYKMARDEQHIGFIAEEVPELLASKDRKGLSAMDLVALLTTVVQEQEKTIQAQQQSLADLSARVKALEDKK